MDSLKAACPPDDVLGGLAQRTLDADEVARVTAHLDECAACQEVMIGAVRAGVATPQATTSSGGEGGAAVRLRAAPGSQLGRYELRGLLGVGGMGAVYDARDTELDRAVALKVLRAGVRDAPELAERLVRESRLMAKVADPSVITVYDVGRDGDTVFIAMELIRGSTLTAWLASHALGWRGVVALFERAGQGLAAAHGAGIVHRDFKPDNVLVARGAAQVVVTDFGIAREVVGAVRDAADPGGSGDGEAASSVSRSAAFGTPAYMAPEQMAGEPTDHRADVFAFSASLWEALFRERPFPGNTIAEIRQAMQRPLVCPPSGGLRVPARLQRALRVGLAIDPRDRWPDMRTLLAELASVRAPRRWIARAAAAVGLVGVGIIAALVATRPAPAIDRCAPALASLSNAYNPRIAAQIRAVLAPDPKIEAAVMAKLDATAEAWRATQVATCRSEREISQHPATTACLEARLQELAGTAESLIANGAGGARFAVRLTGAIGQPAACAEPAAGLVYARVPAERPLRQAVSALRGRLADVLDALNRADCTPALALAESAVADAAAMWPPVAAEALYLQGAVQGRCGDRKRGAATLLDAARTAEHAHHDECAAESWIQLVSGTLFDLGDPVHALEYVTYADAVAGRIGRPPALMVKVEYLRGTALAGVHRYVEAEAAMHQAVALAKLPGSPMRVAQAVQGLGILYGAQGRYGDAVAAYRQAIDSLPRSPSGEILAPSVYYEQLAFNLAQLGAAGEAEPIARHALAIAEHTPTDPQRHLPATRFTLAQVLRELGRDREALAEVTTALAVLAKSYDKRSERYGEALAMHGDILIALARYAEAETVLARACDISAFARAEDDGEVLASCEIAHGAALIGLRRNAQALTSLDHAVSLVTRSYGDSHPRVGKARLLRGAAHAALGHRAPAIADFEHAIAVLTGKQVDPGYLAEAKWRLGMQLWASQPERARAEIAAGVGLFETANGRWGKLRAEATAWLAGRPKPRGSR